MTAEDDHDWGRLDDYLMEDTGPHSDECLSAGHPVIRTNRRTGERFLGCSEYPECWWSSSMNYSFDDHPLVAGTDANPVRKLAFRMSENFNDDVSLGQGNYLLIAEWLLKNFDLVEKLTGEKLG